MFTLRLCLLSTVFIGFSHAQPTYSREISRIVQTKCAICHRPNDIAPFALSGYEDAVTWAADIKRVVTGKIMPPWKPVEGHGSFRDSYALTDEEKRQLIDWIDNGTPLGEEAEMPPPAEAKGDWPLGEPDLILQMKEPYQPPRGKDMYRCFVLPTGFEEDRVISAVDILPGNRKTVHHVILYLDESGEAEKLDGKDGSPGYTCYGGPGVPLVGTNTNDGLSALLGFNASLGGWAPGTRPRPLPETIGMRLSKRARIVMQIHYFTRTSQDPDQTRVGLYFAKKEIQQSLYYLPLVQTKLEIPAGKEDHEVTYNFMVPPFLDGKAVLVFPHMHLLGRIVKAEIEHLGGKKDPLVLINDWDFNWQGPYTYVDPVPFKAFSTFRMSCRYDNSEKNPKNPSNPPKVVKWGENTEDEMCVVFLGVTFDNENLLRGLLR